MTVSGSSEPSPASAASPSAASAAGAAGAAPSSELLGFFFAGAAFFAAPSFDGRFLPFLGSSPVVILTAPLTRSWSTVPASLAALPSTLLRTLPNLCVGWGRRRARRVARARVQARVQATLGNALRARGHPAVEGIVERLDGDAIGANLYNIVGRRRGFCADGHAVVWVRTMRLATVRASPKSDLNRARPKSPGGLPGRPAASPWQASRRARRAATTLQLAAPSC